MDILYTNENLLVLLLGTYGAGVFTVIFIVEWVKAKIRRDTRASAGRFFKHPNQF
ncbi:hypothetical protein LCGC14_1302570 [marine sediment metagenome]|uniref:Uncharacterized protein n=1 Tax=marine sediment metagenome TaxID=412755 RepID=A0A0F9KPJ1_9ZZZZ